MRIYIISLVVFLLAFSNGISSAEDCYLDSPRNKGTLRFELNNDAIFDEDSGFSNGWSIQYHTVRYASWEESKTFGFIKWIGEHFPTLGDEDSIVRYTHGIGQNIITPGDIEVEVPQAGDLPYAGTLTYTLNWQSFNRQKARNFQITFGVLGEESYADEVQKFAHDDLDLGETPLGWDTQRDTEVIINLGYQHLWRLGHWGNYHNGWAAQIVSGPNFLLGNLLTSVDLGVAFRCGWNMIEGFNSFPAPPGRGFFTSNQIPKPLNASPHSVELILGARATGVIYSVLYDGSIITDDDREVEREDYFVAGGIGLNYHYYDFLSIRFSLILTSDIIDEDELPPPLPGRDQTKNDNSFGTIAIDIHF